MTTEKPWRLKSSANRRVDLSDIVKELNEKETERRQAIPPKPRLNRPELPGCETFQISKFRAEKLETIEFAREVIREFNEKGFQLTLRQLFYQFVARGWIKNNQREYDQLGKAVSDGRLNGLIPWDGIVDRTRSFRTHSSWDSPADILRETAEQYQEDLWQDQHYRPEVWIEKDALVGVIEGVCTEWRVPYFSCRGYSSQTLQYDAGKRFQRQLARGLNPLVLHLGDHDPSGLQMTQDITERLKMFAQANVEVMRLALNENQTEGLPPNLVKDTDSRSAIYKFDYGEECWELDALDPTDIGRLVGDAVSALIDHDAWDAAKAHEEEQRKKLREIVRQLQEENAS